MKFCVIGILIVIGLISCSSNEQTIDKWINWPKYMAQHDLVWEEIPLQWNEGAFVGNGQVGMMIYANMEDNRLDFHMGRQDVTDHRKAPNKKTSMGVSGTRLNDFARLDIGRMHLRPVGKIQSMSVRQDLWNAEVRGTITTDLGEITFRAFTPYNRMLNVIEVKSTEKQNNDSVAYQWEWKAGNPISPRLLAKPGKELDEFVPNPKPIIKEANEITICEQSLLAGGDYATAWKETELEKNTSTIYVAIANEVPTSGESAKVASKTVVDASKLSINALEKEHREWWHNYFQQSFISIPDGRMESFFWIQMYKMAACSRADGPALDLLGPFFKNTGWPGLWWNLNVQLTYWPFNASNHLDIAENFITLIDENFDFMLAEKSGANLGDFAWAMHNYWLIYSYKGDQKSIQEKWMPKAMQIAEKYETKLERNENGILELTPMGSPEYEGFKAFKNANYNLAIIRWLLSTLIETSEEINANTTEVVHWKQTLKDLIPYPVDKNGLMIGSEQAVDISHRHYSHLLALYPLFQLDPTSEKDRELIDKSVVHWHKIDNGQGLVGYSYTGAASLYAALGRGNDAYENLQHFLTKQIGNGGAILLTNTFYMEAEGKNPVIETPLSATSAIMEMLLQSWGEKIRVFPATPDLWKDASFHKLRAEGGFLVSASRKNGKTEWVKIKSLAGKPCVLYLPEWKTLPVSDENIKVNKVADGEFQIELKQGQEITLQTNNFKGFPSIVPLVHSREEQNLYGVKRGENYDRIMEYDVPEYEY
jgi:hypothetical protein